MSVPPRSKSSDFDLVGQDPTRRFFSDGESVTSCWYLNHRLQGAAEGIQSIVSYGGPDKWKIVTYAQIFHEATSHPAATLRLRYNMTDLSDFMLTIISIYIVV